VGRRVLVAHSVSHASNGWHYDEVDPEGQMSTRAPKPEMDAVWKLPEPPAADYSDELTKAQVANLRQLWTQDESAMGPVVHEFKWR
jgi:hypothetical protein